MSLEKDMEYECSWCSVALEPEQLKDRHCSLECAEKTFFGDYVPSKIRHISELEDIMTEEQKEESKKLYNSIMGPYEGLEPIYCGPQARGEIDNTDHMQKVSLEDLSSDDDCCDEMIRVNNVLELKNYIKDLPDNYPVYLFNVGIGTCCYDAYISNGKQQSVEHSGKKWVAEGLFIGHE